LLIQIPILAHIHLRSLLFQAILSFFITQAAVFILVILLDGLPPFLERLRHWVGCGRPQGLLRPPHEGRGLRHVHLVHYIFSFTRCLSDNLLVNGLPLLLSESNMRLREGLGSQFWLIKSKEFTSSDKLLIEAEVEVKVSHACLLPELLCVNCLFKG
jgi:hypothetical protein